jgi:hypothetical protein
MKKIFATIAGLVLGTSLVHAQGYLQLTSGTVFDATTNDLTFEGFGFNMYPPETTNSFIPWGKTAPGDQYYMTFLYWAAGGLASSSGSNNLLDPGWVQLAVDNAGTPGAALFATNNASAGNFSGQGGGNSTAAIGINGDAFKNGTLYQVALVAWSSNEGTDWAQVASEASSTFWNENGFFGYVIGNDINPSSAAPGVLIGSGAMTSNGSLILYSVPTPEPTTLALAGLGGLSMLFLRQRKRRVHGL